MNPTVTVRRNHIERSVRSCEPKSAIKATELQSEMPIRKRDRFFGLHFDFHAELADEEIVAAVNDELVYLIIRRVRPDYIQYDSKGHYGVASYPTQLAAQPINIVCDALAIYRRVTAKLGVGLYAHFSGIWDDN